MRIDDPSRRMLACLGNPSRFKVVATLVPGECCVSDIAGRIGLSQSCTTRHLQALQREGLVRGVRRGKRVLFGLRLDEPRVSELILWAVSRDGTERDAATPSIRIQGADVHLASAPSPVPTGVHSMLGPDGRVGRVEATTGVTLPAIERRSHEPSKMSPTSGIGPTTPDLAATPPDLEDFLL